MFWILIILPLVSVFTHESIILQRRKFVLDENNYEIYFSTSIGIGDPQQKFEVCVDIRSSDLWVLNSDCTTGTFCSDPIKNKFNESASKTFLGNGLSIPYDVMTVFGWRSKDTVHFGGRVFNKTSFLLAKEVYLKDGRKNIPGMEGILGFGMNMLSRVGMPLHYEYFNRIGFKRKIFSLRLYSDPNVDSYLNFGTDRKLYEYSIQYVKMSSDKEYNFKANITLGNYMLVNNEEVKLDCGTAFIHVPNDVYSRVMERMTGFYELYPELSFDISGKEFSLRYYDYVDMIDKRTLIKNSTKQWVLGLPFFNKYYTVFDLTNKKIGFAKGL